MPLPAIAWLAIGAAGGWIASRNKFRKEIRSLTEGQLALPPGLSRLPKPGYAVELPTTVSDRAAMDLMICEAAKAGVVRENMANYVLNEIYPDFPWPAIYGDHDTAQRLQGVIDFRVMEAHTLLPNPSESMIKFCQDIGEPLGFEPVGGG